MPGPPVGAASPSGSSTQQPPAPAVFIGPKRLPPDNMELTTKVERLLPSLFPWNRPLDDPGVKLYPFPYTCLKHGVSGRSQRSRPRTCWFGGEDVFQVPIRKAQSQTRGWFRG